MYSYLINKLNYKNFFTITFCVSIISVLSSFILEHVMGYAPCKICLYQRYGWVTLSVLSMYAILFNERVKFTKIIFLIIPIFFIVFISFYHSLLEMGLVSNYFSCQTKNIETKTIEDLDKLIRDTKNTNCEISKFNIFGLTLANIGVIFSMFLLILSLITLKLELFNHNGKK